MTETRPCVHGEVCRAYMERLGWMKPERHGIIDRLIGDGAAARACILSTDCPHGCEFYRPKTVGHRHVS